jgi:hypothetical protein
LQDAGVASKEKTEETTTTQAAVPPTPAPVAGEIVSQVLKELDVEGLNAFVQQAMEDHEKVGTLEELVKELQGQKNDDLAQMLTPLAGRFAWSQKERPSASEKTKVDSTDKVAAKKPGVPDGYWLSEITGTTPVPVE